MNIIKSSDATALKTLLDRSQFQMSDVNDTVESILQTVKIEGDKAMFAFTEQFDGVKLNALKVTTEEWDEGIKALDKTLLNDLTLAKNNIEAYHKKQLRTGYELKTEDTMLGQIVSAVETAGIYVPGGTAAYPSTVLMNAVPAKIAGVKKIVMVTPPTKDGTIKPSILAAAKLAGVDEIYKVGGAQAIAALTYGTESIPKVDKIVGPGNIYVAIAKKMVSGMVGIDMIAGPSEILVLCDETANASYVAADLLSQAEHDKLAAAICITTSNELALEIKAEVRRQTDLLERNEIIDASIEHYGTIVVVDSIDEAFDISNKVAPEHLEIVTKDPFTDMKKVVNAGAIFLGAYTPEPVGDYFAGTNHTLPTSSTARFASALSVDDFIKKTSFVYYSKEALLKNGDSIIRIATDEGLTAHTNAIKIRMED